MGKSPKLCLCLFHRPLYLLSPASCQISGGIRSEPEPEPHCEPCLRGV